MLSKEMYSSLSDVATDELYAISGSGFGFPSDRYDDLELGASGTEYVAPANGYFYIDKITSSTNQYFNFTNKTVGYGLTFQPNASGAVIRFPFKAKKGDVISAVYSAAGATQAFRFIYAEGE